MNIRTAPAVLLFIALLDLSPSGHTQEPLVVKGPYTERSVQDIIERAHADPSILRELDAAPIELVADKLKNIWLEGEDMSKVHARLTKAGKEDEWVNLQRLKRDVLINHPHFEGYLDGRVAYFNEVLTARDDPRLSDTVYAYPAFLFFLEKVPTNVAITGEKERDE